jgi:glycosyltransferase involved in cell wall biosynthesis
MLTRNRTALTRQCLDSLFKSTPSNMFNLTIVDDGSEHAEQMRLVREYTRSENAVAVLFQKPLGITGFARNFGIEFSRKFFGQGDYLYLSDNDVLFTNGWLARMIGGFDAAHGVAILGGQRHPFHGVNGVAASTPDYRVIETDAVAGYSQLMTWATWDRYGPLDGHAKGTGQSEDFAFCRKVIADGWNVGYIQPPVIYNCGITNTEGQQATGAESFPRLQGVLYE